MRWPRDGIVTRSILITLFAFLISGLGIIAYSATVTDKRAAQTIDTRLNQLLDTVQSTVKVACFVNDKGLAKEVADGLLSNSEILQVVISSDDGKNIADESRNGSTQGLGAQNDKALSRVVYSPFDAKRPVGKISLIPNPEVIAALRYEAMWLSAKQLVWQLLVVSILIVSSLIVLLVRPISRMSAALARMNPAAGDKLRIPNGHHNTEIGDLANRINELSQHLVEAIDESREARLAAEAAARAKSAFLANMSHEIRTPLSAVLGLSNIGLRSSKEGSSQEKFASIVDAGSHLLGVINDILDYSKLEAGKFSLEAKPFRLKDPIHNAHSLVEGLAGQKGLGFTLHIADDLPGWVTGDALRLQQILVNLLSNAIKFTPQGTVRLDVTPRAGEIDFVVRDTGIGMSSDEIARLFMPFEQADASTTRKFGGTGLGLAISMNLANFMGGNITVSSTPGKGSAFKLQLPLPETSPPADDASRVILAANPAGKLTGLRVLAAEDVAINQYILGYLLDEAGADCEFVENGQEAVERIRKDSSRYDLILMDVQMPVMDGHEATRRIHDIAPTLPVIGLTAHALAEERNKCLASGMQEHLVKPIDMDQLVAAITRLVQSPTHIAGTPPAAAPALTGTVSPIPATHIDWQELSRRFNGKQRIIYKILDTFVRDHGQTPEALRKLAEAGQFPPLSQLAHNLKGLSGNLAATSVHRLASDTEAAARAESRESFILANALAEMIDELLRESRDHIDSQPATA